MKNNFSDPNTPMLRNLFYVLYKLRVVAAFAFLFGGNSAFADPSFNPITSQGRLWLEWNLIPRTQWAPRSLDSQAKPNKSFYTLKLQPVFPFHLNKNWAVLTRTIFRFVSAPSATPDVALSSLGEPIFFGWDQRNRTGLSDISPTAFFVPNLGPEWTIGVGPSMVIPASDTPTGSGKLSVGPAVLGYYHRGPWMVGARMRNIWSVAGDPSRDDVNRFVAQPLIRYQFRKNWFFTSSPIISSDWTHPDGDGWTVPVGGGFGYSFRLANQPMQISLEGYYNAVKPSFDGEELLGDWTIRTQWQVLFPQ